MNSMLEPTRIFVLQEMVNGVIYLTKDIFGIEGQQHLFRLCHEVGSS